MIDPGKQKLKDTLSYQRMSKRSGKYVKNASGTGITRAPKAEQKVYRKDMKAKIRRTRQALRGKTTSY